MSKYSDLYSTTRTFLGDTNPVTPAYSNGQLDLGIGMALLQDEVFETGEPDITGGQTVAPDVTAKADKLRLAIRSAIALLAPQGDAFSYRTKVLSVNRSNSWGGHLGYLQSLLDELESGGVGFESETEWDQWLRGTSESISALASFPG